MGTGKPQHITSKFNDCALHPQTDAKKWNFIFADKTNGGNFPFNTTLTEAWSNQDTIEFP